MTDALEEFYAEQGQSGPKCSVGRLLRRLPPDQAARLVKALDTPKEDLQTTAIMRVLAKWEIIRPPNDFSINRHRRGDCNCERAA